MEGWKEDERKGEVCEKKVGGRQELVEKEKGKE